MTEGAQDEEMTHSGCGVDAFGRQGGWQQMGWVGFTGLLLEVVGEGVVVLEVKQMVGCRPGEWA